MVGKGLNKPVSFYTCTYITSGAYELPKEGTSASHWEIESASAVLHVIDDVVVIVHVQSDLVVSTILSCLGGAVYFSMLTHVT